ncbi:MAG TPA: hypothetical protein GXZ98_05115 [Firmicutes bacterium]|jgi:flagellar motility protein MotE (MotC chaperone)|nr:hypothetical protein [Bacillota bacterium]
MFRYIAGILTAFLFFGSVFGLLYILDQYNYVDLKPSVLFALSTIPGWEEVAEAYQLGLNHKDVLAERESALATKAEELDAEAKKLEEEKQVLVAQVVALEEKEEYLALEERKLAEQQAQTRIIQQSDETARERYATAARLLEAMRPETAGENLLKMPFEMGVAVLSLLDSRKAGRILETIPPEQSSKYMAELSGH